MENLVSTRPALDPQPARDAETVRAEIMALVDEYHGLAHARGPFDPAPSPAPVNGRVFEASDIKSLVDSALEFWLTTGRFHAQFEQRGAARIGVRSALTVNSGSSANLIAFSALTSPLLGERAL